MKVSDKIKDILAKDKRKSLVFYFDADGSFQEELEDIEAENINKRDYFTKCVS